MQYGWYISLWDYILLLFYCTALLAYLRMYYAYFQYLQYIALCDEFYQSETHAILPTLVAKA